MAKDHTGFADSWWTYTFAESRFEEDLCEVLGGDFDRLGTDHYDASLEIYKVDDHVRLSEAAQRLIYDAGFGKVYVNHKDGWQTHYSWPGRDPFAPVKGWRRRWVADPAAKTTNVIGKELSAENAGYYEISAWPTSWGEKRRDWLTTGYMRIVPDPLEN